VPVAFAPPQQAAAERRWPAVSIARPRPVPEGGRPVDGPSHLAHVGRLACPGTMLTPVCSSTAPRRNHVALRTRCRDHRHPREDLALLVRHSGLAAVERRHREDRDRWHVRGRHDVHDDPAGEDPVALRLVEIAPGQLFTDDDLHLFVYPLALGAGQRLFADTGQAAKFALTGSEAYNTGVLYLTYRLAACPSPAGEFSRDNRAINDNRRNQ